MSKLRFGPKNLDVEAVGPKKTNKNALVHGVYASEFLLPWESREDLLDLHENLRVEWEPQGVTEEETVVTLAWCYWLKRRSRRAVQIAALRDPLALQLGESEETTWSGIRRFLRELAKEEDDASKPFRMMFSYQLFAFSSIVSKLQADDLDDAKRNQHIAELEKIEAMMKRYGEMHATMEANIKTPETAFHAAYKPEDLERTIRIEAMIDARIEKNIARLVSLKEYRALTEQRKLASNDKKLLPSA